MLQVNNAYTVSMVKQWLDNLIRHVIIQTAMNDTSDKCITITKGIKLMTVLYSHDMAVSAASNKRRVI